MLPSASNLMPLDMPLGERKIVVLPVVGIELPDVPGLDGPLLILGDVREGDVAEIDHPIRPDSATFGKAVRFKQQFHLRPCGDDGVLGVA